MTPAEQAADALRPFAEVAKRMTKVSGQWTLWDALGASFAQRGQTPLTVGDLRRAAEALAALETEAAQPPDDLARQHQRANAGDGHQRPKPASACDHAGWSFEKHGRGCPKCGAIVDDPGD